jgi:serine/threonine protein phosphatase PrpC
VRRTARDIVVDFAELSDPGCDPTKQVNEDASGFTETPLGLLSVVCDGMGGHAGGPQASQTAVRVILDQVRATPTSVGPAEAVRRAIEQAGAAVFALGGHAPRDTRPGSTCAAALLTERGAVVAHVGDSRLMLIRSGHLTRLTRDHSLVRQMVDAGVITEAEASTHPDANKITRALGMTPEVEVELQPEPIELFCGDVLLLTSDGVTDLVADPELVAAVQSQLSRGPAALCQELIRLGTSRGGHDNMTVQVLHVLAVPPAYTQAARTQLSVGATLLLEDQQHAGPATARMRQLSEQQGRSPRPTWPDRSQVSATVFDETVRGRVNTVPQQPAVAAGSGPAAPGQQPGFSPRDPHLAPARLVLQKPTLAASTRAKAWTALVAVGAALALGLALGWCGRESVSEPSQDEPPAPKPQPAPAVEAPQQLVADETAERPASSPDASGDASADSAEASADADSPPFP